jgi:hypothetical protein
VAYGPTCNDNAEWLPSRVRVVGPTRPPVTTRRTAAGGGVGLADHHGPVGVSSVPARHLMAEGIRHRRAAVLLGADPAMEAPENLLASATEVARSLVEAKPERWAVELVTFVFERTQRDLGIVTPETRPRGGG